MTRRDRLLRLNRIKRQWWLYQQRRMRERATEEADRIAEEVLP